MCLEISSRKMVEENLIKPKAKIGLNLFLDILKKWRNDLRIKKINHIKLLQLVLDGRDILQCSKIKKI